MAEKKNNPWAICTSSVGRKNKAKYERCVLKVKKETGYHEGQNPVDQIAEMITDDPDLIVECEPNAAWNIGGKEVPGVEFGHEPWEQAMHDIADAWNNGYRIMVFGDDGFLMTNNTDILELQHDDIVYPRSTNDALAYARHNWYTMDDPRATNTGTARQYQDPRPQGDQFPQLESVNKLMDSISEDMGVVGMMAPVQEKSPEEIEAAIDQLLSNMGPAAPVKPEVEPEVEPGVAPDAPEPTEPDPFNPTQPAVDPHPKACDYM